MRLAEPGVVLLCLILTTQQLMLKASRSVLQQAERFGVQLRSPIPPHQRATDPAARLPLRVCPYYGHQFRVHPCRGGPGAELLPSRLPLP